MYVPVLTSLHLKNEQRLYRRLALLASEMRLIARQAYWNHDCVCNFLGKSEERAYV
jgi:hypothetical protein